MSYCTGHPLREIAGAQQPAQNNGGNFSLKQLPAKTISLQTAFFIAAAAHALLVTGLQFQAATTPRYNPLEVTLAAAPTEAKPAVSRQARPPHNPAVLTTQAADTPLSSSNGPANNRQLQAITAQEAKLAQELQAYAERPRIHRLTSLSTLAAIDAEYQRRWQQKIETIGNANYPAAIRQQALSGDVVLMVSLQADGAVTAIRLIRSSGYRELDQYAVTSVRLSAPFAPFPPELKARADILEIRRTWQFRGRGFTTGNS